ncbi:hypothetical protein FSP39_010751 [Pinctada imbricata]|uniref:BZIP domain-containing protein n=1 Tax=Pinctada imbricata TaxID=66713 RepID=A0AA88Y6G9_PINIB|nr:hypothetical protein FSP39_010751 [Pinctada imbricata]
MIISNLQKDQYSILKSADIFSFIWAIFFISDVRSVRRFTIKLSFLLCSAEERESISGIADLLKEGQLQLEDVSSSQGNDRQCSTNAKFDDNFCSNDMADKSNSDGNALHIDSSHSSSSEAGSPNTTSAIPTCIVAPTASDTNSDGTPFIPTRKQREFIPENRKDNHYWEKRRKNNEAARRSREKRRLHDVVLENRIVDLTRDNCQLRNELFAIKKKFGIPLNETFTFDDERPPGKPDTPETRVSPVPVNLSTGSSTMPGYGNAQRAGLSNIALSANQPPTMVPMQSAIPMSVPLHGNYSSKVPIPYYIGVPN